MIEVAESTVKLVASIAPNFTAVALHAGDALLNPVPAIVTEPVPAVGPSFGVTPVTVGAPT